MNLEDMGIRLDVDPLNLETDWRTHAQMVYNVGAAVAEAQFIYDTSKKDSERVAASMSNDMRKNPCFYGIDKVTDKAIESSLLVQREYQDSISGMLEAKRQLGLLKATAAALEQRQWALSKMVDLFVHEYYSDPKSTSMTEEDRFNLRRRGVRRTEQTSDSEEIITDEVMDD